MMVVVLLVVLGGDERCDDGPLQKKVATFNFKVNYPLPISSRIRERRWLSFSFHRQYPRGGVDHHLT